jgi:hypothetical protein
MQFEALPTFHIPKARIEGLGSFLGGFKLTGEESGRGRAWRRVGIAKPLVEFTPEMLVSSNGCRRRDMPIYYQLMFRAISNHWHSRSGTYRLFQITVE